MNNYAFIDGQNLVSGVKQLGWNVDFRKFREYLQNKYHVTQAHYFIGYMPQYQSLYNDLQSYGYILNFKPVTVSRDGAAKGNVDANVVLAAMVEYNEYDKAVIVTSDGDFYCLAEHLYKKQKLEVVLSPNRSFCSVLLRQAAKEKMWYMNELKHLLEYKRGALPNV